MAPKNADKQSCRPDKSISIVTFTGLKISTSCTALSAGSKKAGNHVKKGPGSCSKPSPQEKASLHRGLRGEKLLGSDSFGAKTGRVLRYASPACFALATERLGWALEPLQEGSSRLKRQRAQRGNQKCSPYIICMSRKQIEYEITGVPVTHLLKRGVWSNPCLLFSQ